MRMVFFDACRFPSDVATRSLKCSPLTISLLHGSSAKDGTTTTNTSKMVWRIIINLINDQTLCIYVLELSADIPSKLGPFIPLMKKTNEHSSKAVLFPESYNTTHHSTELKPLSPTIHLIRNCLVSTINA